MRVFVIRGAIIVLLPLRRVHDVGCRCLSRGISTLKGNGQERQKLFGDVNRFESR